MKTREMTADEVNITISAEDISNISYNTSPPPLVDSFAAEAIRTGLRIRGRGTNLFICGPSAPEREAVVLYEAANMKAGQTGKLIINENTDNPVRPIVKFESCSINESHACRAPLIFENNPVPARLFGTAAVSSLSEITPGSLISSAGGAILLNAEDLIEEEESWKLLKRILRTGSTVIGAGDPACNPAATSPRFIMPEVELDFKVIILGNENHYDHFYNSDEDFRELFQFFAELDSVIELTPETLSDSVNIFRNFASEKLGRTLSDEGALETVKYSIASAENITKLSTLVSEVEILLTEAADAAEADSGVIEAADIIKAQKNQNLRYNLLERRILEDIKSGEINLKVDGSEIGKVNGLAVIDKGPWSFGSVGLISARIAPGENGLVNIEHEAGLSGEIHDKWVLILEGFLRSRFAQDFPISIFGSICFEQSYSEIDGDSASSSELYALLSAIAGVPIRQDIAVTGSLSQTGEIQAVGGLREKIEGFHKTCRTINFTGRQGVIIPERNIQSIILPDEIISDISNGRFHIYPVSNVDDSMEILTGMEAGNRNSRGLFPHGSFNYLVEKNLKKIASQAKNFGN